MTVPDDFAHGGPKTVLFCSQTASVIGGVEEWLDQLCTSLDPAVIAAVIQQLATEPGIYAESARASTAIANSVLSKTNFSAQVRAFVGGGAA